MADDGVRLVKPGMQYEGLKESHTMLVCLGKLLEQKRFV